MIKNDPGDLSIGVGDGVHVDGDVYEEPKIDKRVLVQWMMDWEKKKMELDIIEDLIRSAVLDLGKTQVVGNVRATYSAGRKKYNWLKTVHEAQVDQVHLAELELKHKKTVIDYKKIGKELELEPQFTQGDPYVSIKLEEE